MALNVSHIPSTSNSKEIPTLSASPLRRQEGPGQWESEAWDDAFSTVGRTEAGGQSRVVLMQRPENGGS